MQQRVAITGASGLIGGALSAFLSERGDDVVHLVRRPERTAAEISWDPTRRELEPARLEKGGKPLVMERWLLAESWLFEGALRAHAAGGPKTFKKLLKTMLKEAKPPTKAQLVAAYPPLAAWLESLPAEAGIL